VVICLIPDILITQLNVPFYLGGTTLLIVCTVTMDTVNQVQSHLIAQQYEHLMKGGNKVKIRRKWR
jgi:preprotein translocase subunit SecY